MKFYLNIFSGFAGFSSGKSIRTIVVRTSNTLDNSQLTYQLLLRLI